MFGGIIAASNRMWKYRNFNIFIGGVGGIEISSVADLQNYFVEGYNDNTLVVEKFEIEGTTVKARVNTAIRLVDSAFLSNQNITFLIWTETDKAILLDFQGLQSSSLMFFYSFNSALRDGRAIYRNQLEEVSVKRDTNNVRYDVFGGAALKVVHLPSIPNMDYRNFEDTINIEKVYVSSQAYNSTNSGTITALSNVTSNGGQVIEILSYEPPGAIMDLTATDLGNGDYQLNFTPPASANTIQYYEVFVDDGSILSKFKYRERINVSGDVISGINSGDKIWLMAVDEYYNHSEVNSYVNQIGLMSGNVVTI